MNSDDQYMADFMAVFSGVERWGPGSDDDSLRALRAVAHTPQRIVDIGCGKGFATRLLAQHTRAHITAVDNEPGALQALQQYLDQQGLSPRVQCVNASMTALPFGQAQFDLIWAEASAYVMGFEAALQQWQALLQHDGYLVISDLVWLTQQPSTEATAFWKQEYPDMQSVSLRLQQIQQAGYRLVDHFTLSEQAWRDYYQPLKARLTLLQPERPQSAALADIEREIAVFEQHLGEFGYQMFVLQRS